MQGHYDWRLVAVSYFIASLAGYVAIEFATRMRAHEQRRRGWLLGGAFTMGTGIWSMHFIGMTAFSLPVAITFDLKITLLSWLAAVMASCLALFIVGYGKLNWKTLVLGAAIMGAGVCLMHYGGMLAMQMDPGITYRPWLFAASVVIAVAASGAALLIIAKLGAIESWRDIALRVCAALIMGFAVAGMHYTGMAAAIFHDSAYSHPDNELPALVLRWPTSVGSLLILGFGVYFALADARQIARAALARSEQAAWVQRYAFTDRETQMPNRISLQQEIVERLQQPASEGFGVITVRLEGDLGARELVAGLLAVRNLIVDIFPGAALARTSQDSVTMLLNGSILRARRGYDLIASALLEKSNYLNASRTLVGMANAPEDSVTAQALLALSLRSAVSIGEIAARKATSTSHPSAQGVPVGR